MVSDMTNHPAFGARESAESDECSWCGTELGGGILRVCNRQDEMFCSDAHRRASNHARNRLLEKDS